MNITTFLDPAQMPDQSMEQQLFDKLLGQFFTKLPTFCGEFNAGVALFNALSAGSAYALSYVFDSATADADPGAGLLRLNNAQQNSATVLRLDAVSGGQDVSAVIASFASSTSASKGTIRLVKAGDLTKWLMFDVTAVASPNGYRNVSITPVASSALSPFAAGDALLLLFQRTGDRGPIGSNGRDFVIAELNVASAVPFVEWTNLFTDEYDDYTVQLRSFTPSASTSGAQLMPYSGGVLQNASSGTVYFYTQEAFRDSSGATTGVGGGVPLILSDVIGPTNGSVPAGFNGDVRLHGMRGVARPWRAFHVKGLAGNGTRYLGADFGACAQIASPVAGFRLNFGTGVNINSGFIRVIGHRNS